ncbi:beta-lactamase-like protein [Xylariaceae sp. FL0594]|nr:beta-lactamase-like protein [Xylariaceae sp. FL0594]
MNVILYIVISDKTYSGGTLVSIDPKLFCQPSIEGFEGWHAPIYCFLVSHDHRHVIFDLGHRSLIEATTVITPGRHVADVLDSDEGGLGIRSKDIEAVIWSHNHFDRISDITTFPETTELVVGPGVLTSSWPGWLQVSDARVLEIERHSRHVDEIDFDQDLLFGKFKAFDFFGDSSFYLLDAPGHVTRHLCAAARCTADPPTFVFIGADACHHPGIILSRGPLFPDHEGAVETVHKIQELDADDSVFVIFAYDLSLRSRIPTFPHMINNGRERDLENLTRWLFRATIKKPFGGWNRRTRPR